MKNLLALLFLHLILGSCNPVTKDQSEKSHVNDEPVTSAKPIEEITSTTNTLPKEAMKMELKETISVKEEKKKLFETGTNKLDNNHLTVSEPCAIIYLPNSGRIKKLKKEMTENDYATVLDDNMYYLAETRTFLEDRGVKIFKTEATVLEFKKTDGSSFKMDLAKETQLFGIIAFNGKDAPIKLNMTMPDPDFTEYMNK